MRKDPTEFRKRFEEYKNGKMPYENGLPKYDDGKTLFSVEDALQYIMNIENKYKVGLKNGIWRRPTDPKKYDVNQIAYGLDTRPEHNTIVYNFLKKNGRLDDPWLTEKEAHDLMLQTFNAKKYLMDKFVSKYGDNLSLMGYNRVASMLWHGHPFKMMNNPDTITGKALVNAIASGDRDMESVFDAYYMHPANAKLFKARIAEDHRLRDNSPKTFMQKIAKNTVDSAINKYTNISHEAPDGKRVWNFDLSTWGNDPVWMPKEPVAIDYSIGERAPEAISSWNDTNSPALKVRMPDLKQEMDEYNAMMDIFGWNNDSKKKFGLPPLKSLLPSLDEMLLDQTKDYVRDMLQVPLIHPLGNYKSGKLPKFANGYTTSTGIPFIVNNALSHIAQRLRNRMYNTVVPHGYTTDLIYNFIKGNKRELYGDPNKEALFGLYTNQDSIIGNVDLWKQPHGINYRMLSDEEQTQYQKDYMKLGKFAVKDLLRKSKFNPDTYELIYPKANDTYGSTVFRQHDIGKEDWYHNEQLGWYTAGTDLDSYGKYNYVNDKYDINPFKGSSANDSEIFKYGKLIGLDKIDNIVPFGNPYKIDIRDYLPQYKNGKSPIHINPANRGKFNATKKRTGKTTEELTHSKNPLTRKRAIFAQNAKKWKH